jgi:hypothetical protein
MSMGDEVKLNLALQAQTTPLFFMATWRVYDRS